MIPYDLWKVSWLHEKKYPQPLGAAAREQASAVDQITHVSSFNIHPTSSPCRWSQNIFLAANIRLETLSWTSASSFLKHCDVFGLFEANPGLWSPAFSCMAMYCRRTLGTDQPTVRRHVSINAWASAGGVWQKCHQQVVTPSDTSNPQRAVGYRLMDSNPSNTKEAAPFSSRYSIAYVNNFLAAKKT